MFKLLGRLLKVFWFPITLLVLKRLGKTRPWAAKAHEVGTKLKK
jgi:hypothetical protein